VKCKKKDLATTISDEITLSFVMVWNEVKNKQSHTVGTIPKQNIKTVERNKFDTLNKQIHDCSLYRNSCIFCLMKPTGPRPLIYTNSTSIDSALQIHAKCQTVYCTECLYWIWIINILEYHHYVLLQ
jgi:hypothetical protein